MFPRHRFVEAGASAQEADRIEQEYDALSADAQQGLEEYWASIAEGDLTEWLAQWREHYEELPSEPETAGTEGEATGEPAAAPADAPKAASAPPAPNDEVTVQIGKDGTGYADLVGLGSDPEGITQLHASDGNVAVEPLPDNDPPLLRLVVSGAKAGSQVTVAYYSAPE